MINFKKALSLLCGAALVATTLVMPITNVSAAPTLSFGLKSSETEAYTEDGETYTYAILTCEGLSTEATTYKSSS